MINVYDYVAYIVSAIGQFFVDVKREDIGGIVLFAMFFVELLNLGIAYKVNVNLRVFPDFLHLFNDIIFI